MKKKPDNTSQQRRDFLQKSVTTAAIAVTAPGIAVAGALDGSAQMTQENEAGAPSNKAGYRLSPHVLAYYKSCMR